MVELYRLRNSNMDFSVLAIRRQSDRKYLNKAVEKEKIMQCLETARLSPSANNSQPWKFIVVDDQTLKEQIADCAHSMGMNAFTHQAPLIIAVVIEKQNILSSVGSILKDKPYYLLDIGMAVNQLCLQAADIGLGSCIIGWFNEKKVKKLLEISSSKRVPLLITLGYPASETRIKKRKTIDEITSWNKY